MAAYVKQSDQVVLILGRAAGQLAVASADLVLALDAGCRAFRDFAAACEPGSRSGAAIQ